QQHLGHRDPPGFARVSGPALPRRPGGIPGRRRQVQARGLGRVRRKPGRPPSLRGDLRLSPQGRPASDPVGRQHGGDAARGGGRHVRRQRRDGLRHRRRPRRARPRDAVRRQGGTGGLRAGAGRAPGRARRASRDRRGARPDLPEPRPPNAAIAERQDRRRGRGPRHGRQNLPDREAPFAVTAALQRANQVALALAVVAAIAVAAGGFASVAPNRLLSGKPVMLWQAAGAPASTAVVALVAALAAGAFARWRGIGAILGAALLLAVLYAAGDMADRLKGVVSLGAAFWTLLGAAALAVVDGMQRSRAGPLAMLGTAVAILAAAALMAAAGWFDGLSLAREFHTRHDVFGPAVLRHIELVAGSVVPAIAIAVPLGLGTVRHPNWRGPIFATLNLLQTIPSIALFGLLIAPLTALGIGGVGPAPALIALVLYALLPVARSTAAGLGGIDPA